MTLYRIAVSTSQNRVGDIIAVCQPEQGFGTDGEKEFFGPLVDLPKSHPLLTTSRYGTTAKNAWKFDFSAAGTSSEELAKIVDRNQRSPDGRVRTPGGGVDPARSKVAPARAIVRACPSVITIQQAIEAVKLE